MGKTDLGIEGLENIYICDGASVYIVKLDREGMLMKEKLMV